MSYFKNFNSELAQRPASTGAEVFELDESSSRPICGSGGCKECGCGSFSPYGENDSYCYCGHHFSNHY